jgi:hypothetical protein
MRTTTTAQQMITTAAPSFDVWEYTLYIQTWICAEVVSSGFVALLLV